VKDYSEIKRNAEDSNHWRNLARLHSI